MNTWLVLVLAGSATALATGLGAIPVFVLGERAVRWRPMMWGLSAGLMTVASLIGLILPGLHDGSVAQVAGGALAGAALLVVAQRVMGHSDPTFGDLRGADVRRAVLIFAVLFVHSFPEGFAIGTAYASATAGLGLYVILAIALQNVPEGTSIAIPMEAGGFSHSSQFWWAVGTSVPQPIGAVVAYALVSEIEPLLPISFGFAAGAMLALVALELLPQAYTRTTWRSATVGVAIGGGLMVALSALLGV